MDERPLAGRCFFGIAVLLSLAVGIPARGADPATRPGTPRTITKDGVTTEVHAIGAGEPGADGWVAARSEQGGFTVELPGRYNDATISGKSVKGNTVLTHIIGMNIPGRGKFSATRMQGGDAPADDATAKAAMENMGNDNRPPASVTKNEQAGGVAYEVAVGRPDMSARLRCFARDGSLYMMIVEFPPDAPASISADIKRFFGSIKLDERNKKQGGAPTGH
jgi:hypothetical protein